MKARFSTSGKVEQWLNERAVPTAPNGEAWEMVVPGGWTCLDECQLGRRLVWLSVAFRMCFQMHWRLRYVIGGASLVEIWTRVDLTG